MLQSERNGLIFWQYNRSYCYLAFKFSNSGRFKCHGYFKFLGINFVWQNIISLTHTEVGILKQYLSRRYAWVPIGS